MGGINVKNTIVEWVLRVVAPHPCSGCGKVGYVLCDYCKYDIVHEPFVGCILCAKPSTRSICDLHHVPIEQAYVVGSREGALQATIDLLKFSHTKSAALPLAELLDYSLPLFPKDVYIVPIPTLSSHIRQRGYDQVDLITRHLAHIRGMRLLYPLKRATKTTQHIVDREKRQKQAETAFKLDSSTTALLKGKPILLVDDIITTGSTIVAVATLLAEAGAIVYVAALAYQPLD